jgi:hypothetical protein
MRWAMLYARSRQLPAAAVALVAVTAGVWFLSRDSWSPIPAALALTAGIAVAAIGLSGQDADLDRAAALPWPVRRFTHLVLIGVVAGVLVLGVQELGPSAVDLAVVVRDTAGLVGLGGLAAAIAGGQFGWTLPLAWFTVSPLVPRDGSTVSRVTAWLLQPPETAPATWTAVVLAVLGVVSYTGWGGRR